MLRKLLSQNLEPYERYVPEERVADGGQGEVYRGWDRLTGQPADVYRAAWERGEALDAATVAARFLSRISG
jgi:hypothetical protein